MAADTEILREFLVKLGFKTDERALKNFTANVESATAAVAGLVAKISGAALAVSAGVAAFAANMEVLFFSARKAGSSATNMKAFEKAMANFGVSASEASQSVQSLARWMRETPASEGFLKGLGVQTRDANGKLKDTTALMVDLGRVLAKMDYPMARQFGSMFGLGEDAMRALMDGKFSAELDRQRKILSDMGFEDGQEQIMKFMQSMRDMGTIFEAVGAKIGNTLLKVFGSDMTDIAKVFLNNSDSIANAITNVGNVLVTASGIILPILNLIAEGWKKIFTWVDGAGEALRNSPFANSVGRGMAWLFDKLGIRDQVDAALAGGGGQGGSPAGGSAGSKERLAAIEKKYGLPAGLLDSVWAAESGRGKNMHSAAGAEGHFQFMPSTAKQYGLANPYDFDQSADAAGRMYRDLMARYGGNLQKAVAAYNWGPGNVDRQGLGRAPAETRAYLDKVMGGMGVQIAQNTTINVNGGDAGATGRAVAGEQDRVNQNLARNLQTAVN